MATQHETKVRRMRGDAGLGLRGGGLDMGREGRGDCREKDMGSRVDCRCVWEECTGRERAEGGGLE